MVLFRRLEDTNIIAINNSDIIVMAVLIWVLPRANRIAIGTMDKTTKAHAAFNIADSVVIPPAHIPAMTKTRKTWCTISVSLNNQIPATPQIAPDRALVMTTRLYQISATGASRSSLLNWWNRYQRISDRQLVPINQVIIMWWLITLHCTTDRIVLLTRIVSNEAGIAA